MSVGSIVRDDFDQARVFGGDLTIPFGKFGFAGQLDSERHARQRQQSCRRS